MIRAGTKSEISPTETWLILDIGFANKSASCGLMINRETPVELRFNEVKERICNLISNSNSAVNLLIEAPLSVAFDSTGNPKGRAVEKQNGKTRYWYSGLGCSVMVAAMYLVKAIADLDSSIEVRLFEGFVSFKEKGTKSNHSRDVRLLREAVENPQKFSDSIIEPDALKMDSSDILKSAFLVAGIDAGVPTLIMRNG